MTSVTKDVLIALHAGSSQADLIQQYPTARAAAHDRLESTVTACGQSGLSDTGGCRGCLTCCAERVEVTAVRAAGFAGATRFWGRLGGGRRGPLSMIYARPGLCQSTWPMKNGPSDCR